MGVRTHRVVTAFNSKGLVHGMERYIFWRIYIVSGSLIT